MEVKLLQIGDYVNYRGQIIQITSLYDKGGSNEVGWSDKECVWVNADNVEPIPLTKEILEKNGFEKSYSSILTADGYKKIPQYKYKNMTQGQDICRNLITISYSELEGGVYDIQCGIGSHIYDLKYVNQLQHALRLCGIEKEIIL